MRRESRFCRFVALLWLGGASFWSGAGCGSGDNQSGTRTELPSQVRSALNANTPVAEAHVTATNRFGFEVLRELRNRDAAKNIVLSPFSLALALQIVYNGARTDTEAAMAQTLHLQDVSFSELNARNAALQASLSRQEPSTTLNIANGLWVREGKINPAFIQVNTDYYGSKIGNMQEVPAGVNTWVNLQTNGKIPTLLPTDMDYSETLFVVVNAVYFKGAWTDPFDPKQTRDAPFTTPTGEKTVRMMCQEKVFPYRRGEGFAGVRLPFGKQKRLSFVVLLPDSNSSLSALLAQVTPEKWTALREQFRPTQLMLGLPRLKTAFGANMIPPLSKLGMEIAFDPLHADFQGLGDDDIYLQFAFHKATLELTEEGAEAAAATAIGGGVASVPPSFVVDRPFLCAIEDETTGTLLFLGAIVDPTQE